MSCFLFFFFSNPIHRRSQPVTSKQWRAAASAAAAEAKGAVSVELGLIAAVYTGTADGTAGFRMNSRGGVGSTQGFFDV